MAERFIDPGIREQVSAVILAGGRSRRMGGQDKAFIEIDGHPLIRWVIERLLPQVGEIFIAANPTDPRYRSLGPELIADPMGPDYGPLAGILAGLERADTPYIVTAPCDTPFLPETLVARLFARIRETDGRVVTASDGARLHGTVSLIDRGLAPELRGYLQGGGRKVRDWLDAVDGLSADFSEQADAFLNINTGDDVARAESLFRSRD